MRDLRCQRLQFDELWGFIAKKERHVRPDDNPQMGDVWTFCAIDPDTKLVPAFKVGKRTVETTYFEELREVIRRLHGVDSRHIESVPVTETFQGRTV
jgi:IS1 family transposase